MVHQNLLDEGKIKKRVGALRSREACPPELAATFRMEADYFEKNAARVRYPEFRRQHLLVGTGVRQAGCTTVIGSCLKPSGMFWTVGGANTMLALRRSYLSGRFEDYEEARRA